MFLAKGLDKGLGPLVGEHGKAWPQVVLNLVVEVSMHEVINVTASPEINRSKDLTKVERARVRSAPITEAIHVISSMVCYNGHKAMEVSEKISKEKVLHCRNVHLISSTHVFSNGKQRQWEEEKVDHEVGSNDNGEEF
eukprot:637191_1